MFYCCDDRLNAFLKRKQILFLLKLSWFSFFFSYSKQKFRLKNKKHQKKSFGHVIHYDILTKLALFKSYLQSSESIELKFSSGISNIDIGKANIPIPIELIEFIDGKLVHCTKKVGRIRKRTHIFSAQHKKMGEVLLDFDLMLYDRVISEAEMTKEISSNKCMDSGIEIENDMNHFNLDLELKRSAQKIYKKNAKIKSPPKQRNAEKSPEELSKLNSKRLSGTNTMPSPLLNYLTGRPLGKFEETEAVKAMKSTSPTESLIDLLSFDLNGLYLPKKTDDTESKILQKIDCLRVHVFDLCLTRAGTREILSNYAPNEASFSSGTFTVDVDIDTVLTTKSPFEKSALFTSKVTRIFSSSIETLPPCKFELCFLLLKYQSLIEIYFNSFDRYRFQSSFDLQIERILYKKSEFLCKWNDFIDSSIS